MKITHCLSLSLVVVFALASFAGCGADVDNVQSCKDWIAGASCGTTDFSTLVNCSLYENTECDISEYFDCLSTATKCTNGVLDASGYQACLAKATCE